MAETTADEVHSQLSGLVTLQPPLEKGEKKDGESGSTGAEDEMDGQDAEEVQVAQNGVNAKNNDGMATTVKAEDTGDDVDDIFILGSQMSEETPNTEVKPCTAADVHVHGSCGNFFMWLMVLATGPARPTTNDSRKRKVGEDEAPEGQVKDLYCCDTHAPLTVHLWRSVLQAFEEGSIPDTETISLNYLPVRVLWSTMTKNKLPDVASNPNKS